ncbi:MAG TPA: hypothetical protein VGB30_05715 [bacterium]|jgi:lipid-A-disaccharide synthase
MPLPASDHSQPEQSSTGKSPLILFSTGDLSGDMHASHLLPRLQEEWRNRHPDAPPLRFAAAGASHLKDAGAEIWEDTTYWGAMGIFEGIKILPQLLAAKKRMKKRIFIEKPDLVITVDYRSFNMSLLKDVRTHPDGARQKTAYYISPVLWWTGDKKTAERKAINAAVDTARKIPGMKKSARDRFDAMSELCDLCLVAYPFNLNHYENAGVNFRYIGHPLMPIIKEYVEKRKYLEKYSSEIDGKRLICIAPGSRLHELKYHIPVLRETVERLDKRYPDLWFFCPVPSPKLESVIREGFGSVSSRIFFVPDDCYDLMNEADLMIVKSGTSVQLALLMAVPAVTFYKITSEWMEKIGRKFFQDLPFYAFPNLLAGREVVKELIQSNFNLPNLYVACTELLDDPAVAGHMRQELADIRRLTIKDDPPGESAKLLIDLIEKE